MVKIHRTLFSKLQVLSVLDFIFPTESGDFYIFTNYKIITYSYIHSSWDRNILHVIYIYFCHTKRDKYLLQKWNELYRYTVLTHYVDRQTTSKTAWLWFTFNSCILFYVPSSQAVSIFFLSEQKFVVIQHTFRM